MSLVGPSMERKMGTVTYLSVYAIVCLYVVCRLSKEGIGTLSARRNVVCNTSELEAKMLE